MRWWRFARVAVDHLDPSTCSNSARGYSMLPHVDPYTEIWTNGPGRTQLKKIVFCIPKTAGQSVHSELVRYIGNKNIALRVHHQANQYQQISRRIFEPISRAFLGIGTTPLTLKMRFSFHCIARTLRKDQIFFISTSDKKIAPAS